MKTLDWQKVAVLVSLIGAVTYLIATKNEVGALVTLAVGFLPSVLGGVTKSE